MYLPPPVSQSILLREAAASLVPLAFASERPAVFGSGFGGDGNDGCVR
jgi:hypothetical protein